MIMEIKRHKNTKWHKHSEPPQKETALSKLNLTEEK